MQWQNIPSFSGNEVYHLSDNQKVILSLSYHPFSNSARIDCDGEKRVFMIRHEGFRRNKTVVRNEYGVKVCELGVDNGQHYINVNDERFIYKIHRENGAEISIFREASSTPTLVCSINEPAEKPALGVIADKNLLAGTHPGLLIALCWYMLMPVSVERREFAFSNL